MESTITQADLRDLSVADNLPLGADTPVTALKAHHLLFPSYLTTSFHYMLSHVLAYFGNVLHSHELLLWNEMLKLVNRQVPSSAAAAADASPVNKAMIPRQLDEERDPLQASGDAMLDFLLRLCARKPMWFALVKLEDTYLKLKAPVSSIVRALLDQNITIATPPAADLPSSSQIPTTTATATATMTSSWVQLVDGVHLVDYCARGYCDFVREVLMSVRMDDLKEVALLVGPRVAARRFHADRGNVAPPPPPTTSSSLPVRNDDDEVSDWVTVAQRIGIPQSSWGVADGSGADSKRKQNQKRSSSSSKKSATSRTKGGENDTSAHSKTSTTPPVAVTTSVPAKSSSSASTKPLSHHDDNKNKTPQRQTSSGMKEATTPSSSSSPFLRLESSLARKQLLVRFLMHPSTIAEPSFPTVWDEKVGPMLRVHVVVKRCMQLLSNLFHILSQYHPPTRGGGGGGNATLGMGSVGPLPSSNLAVLGTIHRVSLPMTQKLPMFYYRRFFTSRPVEARNEVGDASSIILQDGENQKNPHSEADPFLSGDDPVMTTTAHQETAAQNELLPLSSPQQQQLLLFGSRQELDLFLEGLELQVELFDVVEGFSKFKKKDVQYVQNILHRVESGLKRCAEIDRRYALLGATTSRKNNNQGPTKRDLQFQTVRQRLDAEGASHLNHLAQSFLPICKWLRCASYVAGMLESHRQYEAANRIYQKLLHTPIHEVRRGGVVLCKTAFRYHKRGEWLHRIALNMTHLGQTPKAISFLEEVLQAQHGCGDQWATVMSTSAEQQKPSSLLYSPNKATAGGVTFSPQVARLARLTGWTEPHAARSLAYEALTYRFLRRSDRLTLERLRMRLHRPPHRWGPPPKDLLVSTVREAPSMFLHAEQDAWFGTNGWSDAHRSKVPLRVEQFVLEWFRRGRGRREVGWDGMHCEGAWVSALTAVLFPEVFTWDPDPLFEEGDGAAGSSLPPKTSGVLPPPPPPLWVWMSPFQFHPMDVVDMPVFSERRRSLLQHALERLRGMNNAELVELVAQRVAMVEMTGEDEEELEVVDDSGAREAEDVVENISAILPNDGDGEDVAPSNGEASPSSSTRDRPVPSGGGGDKEQKGRKRPRTDDTEKELLSSSSDDEEEGKRATHDDSSNDDTEEDDEDDDDDEGLPPLGQTGNRPQDDERNPNNHDGPNAASSSDPRSSRLHHKYDISHIPSLLDLVRCLPIIPFSRLVEMMFLSAPDEGYTHRYSGFPDLVVWRIPRDRKRLTDAAERKTAEVDQEATSAQGSTSATNLSALLSTNIASSTATSFLLAEVKSTNDSLSDKQIAVNDMLLQCGFDVRVVGIVNQKVTDDITAPRPRGRSKFEPKVAQQRLVKRVSSSFVKGTAVNPMLL